MNEAAAASPCPVVDHGRKRAHHGRYRPANGKPASADLGSRLAKIEPATPHPPPLDIRQEEK